jgi:DNA invertase Pin-like site-specific DNA recombinase
MLQGLHEMGVGLFLHQQGPDTSTTAGKAMFQMLACFAEFERGMSRERVNAGLAGARAKGTKLGRRPVKPSVEARIRELALRVWASSRSARSASAQAWSSVSRRRNKTFIESAIVATMDIDLCRVGAE